MSITKKLPKEEFDCDMCTKYYFRAERYVYETWGSDKTPSRELIVCRRCAVRECGSKHKKVFDQRFE